MKIIGLTGHSGAGKSTAAHIISDHGYTVLNADEIYHGLIGKDAPLSDQLAEVFGDEILKDGAINRTVLSKIVFSDSDALKTLNEISHAAVISETERLITELEKNGENTVFYDAPQLFEAGFDSRCAHIIAILAHEDVRLHRIMTRDKLDSESVLRRFKNQKTEDFFKRNCDIIIYNDRGVAELEDALANAARIMELKW